MLRLLYASCASTAPVQYLRRKPQLIDPERFPPGPNPETFTMLMIPMNILCAFGACLLFFLSTVSLPAQWSIQYTVPDSVRAAYLFKNVHAVNDSVVYAVGEPDLSEVRS